MTIRFSFTGAIPATKNGIPTLALQGKWDSINIGVGVIAALGDPSHICLLRNMKEKSLAVVACDGKDNMSIRVPEDFLELHKGFKIHSKQFVYETLTGWGLDPEKTYSFKSVMLLRPLTCHIPVSPGLVARRAR